MRRIETKSIADIIPQLLRDNGLETPLLQKRVIDSWDEIVGASISKYTEKKFISNQVLFIKISNPALRHDLNLMRSQLLHRIIEISGVSVITDVRII